MDGDLPPLPSVGQGRPTPSPAGGEGARSARESAAQERAAVDWEEVRRAYELSGESVAAIQERFRLTKHQLTKRRIAEAWTTRPPIAKRSALPPRRQVGAEALELKLNKLLVTGIAMLAKRLAEEGLTDQNARALTELCRAEEIRMRSTRTRTAKAREMKKHDAGYDFRDDPACLDAEINRRLDRLNTAGGAGGDPAQGDAGGEAGVPHPMGRDMGAG